jgi:hypothetical protein
LAPLATCAAKVELLPRFRGLPTAIMTFLPMSFLLCALDGLAKSDLETSKTP